MTKIRTAAIAAALLAGVSLLPACVSIDPAVIDALGKDPASPCIGAQGYGVGLYVARANDPTIAVKVGPTGCEITHAAPAPASTTVVVTAPGQAVHVVKP